MVLQKQIKIKNSKKNNLDHPSVIKRRQLKDADKQEKKKVIKKKMDLKNIAFGGISKKSVLYFTKNLAILIKTGSTLIESLSVLEDQLTGKFKVTVADIISQVQKGIGLSEALKKYPKVFSEIYVNIVRIGEESGTLDKNLKYLAGQLEKNYKLKKQIIGAMIYPMIILGGTVLLAGGVGIFILPKISQMFKNFQVKLPLTTRIMIVISDFFQNHGILAVSVVIVAIVLLVVLSRMRVIKPFLHGLILKLPVIGRVSKNYNLTMFYRSMSILLQTGSTVDEALSVCSLTVTNIKYKRFIENTYKQIKGGGSLYDIILNNKKLIPPTDSQIINVGEESGTMADSFTYVAEIRDDELNDITKNLSVLLEPILFILLGIAVGLLAMSIIAPIYSITESF
ncbi:hypothetical protein COT97_02850 [Candidatus Falkowbacteria bacterium CG10_big_fil_rev_8_21_14_0_10_39_11]|uniref:Type II secretion system protein GspF domain-containing protein n=1 Tax=Candidatus Falkowbacteria bacterium CG10_big_fil_rev_8_21_14_0_10_39_11 TaxID=1974565 RepID=A0A2H0V6U8_9BACT|nr:MAG: hypothetical protein COT97_02850 [Candidatus Falkowbacteria bacterium CG10_big_fil_rev_8_21_14_0_10_39_11]